MGELSKSQEYKSFRSSVPQKRLCVDDDSEKVWTLYDTGPKSVRCPLMCMPPASGKADIFFKQMLALSASGYRVIGVEYPVYWTLKEFNEGFRKLLDHLQLDKVHLFGASLGGFMAQKFAEYTHISPRVHSMVLCNSFVDTTIFQQTGSAPTFWMMPALVLKKTVMNSFNKNVVDSAIADSIDFMVESLDGLGQQELASRLTLNCMNSYVEPQKLKDMPVTVMDVYDECALSQGVKDEMYKCYPEARRAHLKNGGNFPYLSRAEEVNVYLQVHLRQFWNTRYSAMEPTRDFTRQSQDTEPEASPSAANS